MKVGDLVSARRGDTRFAEGTPALVVDICSNSKRVAVRILVDRRLIWVSGEMLEVLNAAG